MPFFTIFIHFIPVSHYGPSGLWFSQNVMAQSLLCANVLIDWNCFSCDNVAHGPFVIKQDNSVLNWNPERKRVDPPYFSVDELLRDTDSEEEDETKKKVHKPKDKTQAKLAWLQEGGDIMDFLDPSASRKVLGNGNTRKDGSN